MEESLEIYQLRLEHKRFLEDAEQERASKEKLREELVAEIHRRADAEKTNRALKDENMRLRLQLERLERLERGRKVEAPGSSTSTGTSSKKTVETTDVIEILDGEDGEKMPFPAKSLKMRSSSASPKKSGLHDAALSTIKGEDLGAEKFNTAMGYRSQSQVAGDRTSTSALQHHDKTESIKLKPESSMKSSPESVVTAKKEATSSMKKKRDVHQLSDPEEVKEAKKAKVQPDTIPLPSRDKQKRKEVVEDSSSRITQSSSFTDSTGVPVLDASATSSVIDDLSVDDMPQSSAKGKDQSIPTSKASTPPPNHSNPRRLPNVRTTLKRSCGGSAPRGTITRRYVGVEPS